MHEILEEAFKEGYAIPQPDFINFDMAASYLKGASDLQSPVILGFGEDYVNLSGFRSLTYVAKGIELLSEEYDIPIVLHLDHGSSYEACVKAVNAGFSSVMIDGSSLSFEENVKLTKKVVDMASQKGVSVEGELGRLKTGAGYDLSKGDEEVLTDPDAATSFIKKTEVDALAISIGNVHGEYQGPVDIRMDLLEEIRNSTETPLVLHGSSGLPKETLHKCAKLGITKVNIYTDFAKGVNKVLKNEYKHNQDDIADIPFLLNKIQNELKNTMKSFIKALGSEDKA